MSTAAWRRERCGRRGVKTRNRRRPPTPVNVVAAAAAFAARVVAAAAVAARRLSTHQCPKFSHSHRSASTPSTRLFEAGLKTRATAPALSGRRATSRASRPSRPQRSATRASSSSARTAPRTSRHCPPASTRRFDAHRRLHLRQGARLPVAPVRAAPAEERAYVPNMLAARLRWLPECYTARASSTCSVVQGAGCAPSARSVCSRAATTRSCSTASRPRRPPTSSRNSSGCTAAPLAACRTTRSTSARRTRGGGRGGCKGEFRCGNGWRTTCGLHGPEGCTCSAASSEAQHLLQTQVVPPPPPSPPGEGNRHRRRRRRHRRRRRRRDPPPPPPPPPAPPSAPSVLGNLWRVMVRRAAAHARAAGAARGRPSPAAAASAANGARRCEISRRCRDDLSLKRTGYVHSSHDSTTTHVD